MVERDPLPGDAPDGGPADGRSPAPPASFEQSAREFAALPPGLTDGLAHEGTSGAAHDGAYDSGPDPYAPPAVDPAPSGRSGGFREWRGKRPFAGGLLMALGGAEILLSEKASIGVVVHIGMQGLTGYLIPAVLLVCGVLTIFNPQQRMFYSVIGVLLALGSWVTSNLGGFFVGLILGILGACLSFGWVPDQEPRERRRRRPPTAPAEPPAGAAHP